MSIVAKYIIIMIIIIIPVGKQGLSIICRGGIRAWPVLYSPKFK